MIDNSTKQKAIQAIIDSNKEVLTPVEIAPILGVDPHYIRIAAKQRPELLKFEFFISGNRTKIPRIPFLRYIGINVDQQPSSEKPQAQRSPFDHSTMTNEELLLAITNEINTFKQEINARLDNIERQTKDLNNVLQSARCFLAALSGVIDTR